MTNEERAQIAIDAMKYFKQILYNGIYGEFVGNFDTAISALEKQMPKKVEVTKYDIGGNDYFCHCGNKLRNVSEYCDMCGCKLDWSGTE